MVSRTVDDFALRRGEQDHEPTPADTEKFARMLEESSLGSDDSRQARLDGARVLAEHSITGSPWVDHAASWPDITTLHQQIASIFEAEGQSEPSELWLRAALNRKIDGPTATRLAALLEQHRATKEAVVWYQRAAETGDPIATARLAVMCELKGSQEIAALLLTLGRSQMARGRLVRADTLAGALAMASRRHRAKLISECDDEHLLFWVGCALLVASQRDAAAECYSAAALSKGHPVATLSLFDLQMSPARDGDHAVADVQSLTNRLTKAIETKPTGNITTLLRAKSEPKSTIGDDLDVLVGSAAVGDRGAIEGVFRWIRPLVLRYCRARVGSQEKTFASADDVAQEVCLAVLTALPSYRDQGRPFLAFVYGIAAHKVADAHRSAARNRAEPIPEVPDSPELGDAPEQRTMQGELAGRMYRLLDMLPEKQREILVLRVLVGLSAEETADAVGSTPGAVRIAQHRALGRLHNVLASEGVV